MKTNILSLMIMTSLIGLSSANALEVCSQSNTQTVIEIYSHADFGFRDSPAPRLIKIFEDGKLLVSDRGPNGWGESGFIGGPCKVDGAEYSGEILTFGGCFPIGSSPIRTVGLRDGTRNYDLNDFRCVKSEAGVL